MEVLGMKMKNLRLIVIGICCIIIATSVFSVLHFKQSEDYQYTTSPVQLADDKNYTAEKLNSLVDSFNIFSLDFYQKISENINEGVSLSKRIVRDAGRIVLPSNGEKHIDHQATHIIVKRAIVDLNQRAEYYIYASYCILTAPKNKQVKIDVSKYREKKYEIMKNYKTQLCIEPMVIAWENFKHKRYERFGVFNYEDIGKFDNF